MQETRRPDGTFHREFFINGPKAERLMDERMKQLQARGHTIVGRKVVGWNQPCPCSSGKKFKKCCGRGLR